jgi:hypothetical protein
MAEHDDSTATILFALGANAVIALAKGVVAWITGSTSMVAEAVHSVADCGNQMKRLTIGLTLWFLFSSSAFAQMGTGQGSGMMGGNWGWGMGYGWGFGLIIVILVVVGIVYMMKRK